MRLAEKLEYLDNVVEWYIGTDNAEEFADYLQGNVRRWGRQSRMKICLCTNISESYFRRLQTCSSFVTLYIFMFSYFYIFILLLRISPLHFSCLSSCVLIPLLEFCSADCFRTCRPSFRTCRPNPVVSDRDKEPEPGVRCPLPICYSRDAR